MCEKEVGKYEWNFDTFTVAKLPCSCKQESPKVNNGDDRERGFDS
jgi:hypothetical protein